VANARKTAETTAYAGSRRRLRLWFAFVAIFMAWALYTWLNQMSVHGDTGVKLAAMQEKLAERAAESAALQLQIERLGDPEYIKELARKEQGMIMPGEKPIQVTESP
jgi:cell division protein DivIC